MQPTCTKNLNNYMTLMANVLHEFSFFLGQKFSREVIRNFL